MRMCNLSRRVAMALPVCMCMLVVLSGSNARGDQATKWDDRLAGANAGSTIILPAGVFAGGMKLPAGVSLRGAGYGKTIIDASNADIGLQVGGTQNAAIADLTIRGARQLDLQVKDSAHVTVTGVRTTGSMTGLVFEGVKAGRIENCLSDSNRYGFVIGGGEDDVIVNCTAADNSSLGLSFPSGKHTVAFNNCVAHSATGVYLGTAAEDLHLDFNVYAAMYVGKMEGQVGRKMMGEWTTLCGQDAHSVEQAVTFGDAKAGDFSAANTLNWALDRTATSGWGRREFAGVNAPEKDIAGAAQGTLPDAGCFVKRASPSRPADGSLTISGKGIASAGIFTRAGREVGYLFQNLPLAAGKYDFWFPPRDFQGKLIAAGQYEVRIAESALQWQYLGLVGNSGQETPVGATAAVNTAKVAFDDQGQLITACDGWAENFVNLRAYDAKGGTWHWAFHAAADVRGVAGAPGLIYALRRTGKQERLTRVDAHSGKVSPWPSLKTGEVVLTTGADATSLAELDGRLFFTDTTAGKIFSSSADNPDFSVIATIPGAASIAADAKSHLLWIIAAGGQVQALSADGKPVAASNPVAGAVALAVRDGVLAVASTETGKVHFYDCADANHLKPVRTIGRGDGPYGAFETDRFGFQRASDSSGYAPALSLSASGELAVADRTRLSVFDSAGKPLWHTFGVFGSGGVGNYADRTRIFEFDGKWSHHLDEKTGVWTPDGLWQQPKLPKDSMYLGDFSADGKAFGVYELGRFRGNILIVRLQDYKQIPLVSITRGPKGSYEMRKDTNHDGAIDEADKAEPMNKQDLLGSQIFVQPNGDLLSDDSYSPTRGFRLLRLAGLDSQGIPHYDAGDFHVVTQPKAEPMISPYTFKPEPNVTIAGSAIAADGGFTALLFPRSNPGGAGLFNGAGTDVAGIDATGRLRWFHPLARHQGLYGLWTVGDITFTGVGTTTAVLAFDRDGLGLGSFNQLAVSRYIGYWLDHPQALYAWKGADGNTYVMICDNFNGCNHWWRLNPKSSITHSTASVTLPEKSAEALAAQSPPDASLAALRPATATVHIPRLAAPMPIDGDLQKWRAAGVSPNIIITPETAVAGINGPADCSAVIRVAYQGSDLYVQVLRFDDVVTFHQPLERHYLQDCVEMCINGFGPGFKFDITRTTDKGDIIIRQRFFSNKLEALLPPEHCPRVIKVLDDATGVPERKLIESIYGQDLSKCKVIVTEFKLPIDDVTYAGAVDSKFPVAPGKTFWLGFMIDDNDEPGTDVQRLMVWPATYGTFNPPQDSAQAIFDE